MAYAQIGPDSTGKKIATSELTDDAGNDIHRQEVVICDSATPDNRVNVTAHGEMVVTGLINRDSGQMGGIGQTRGVLAYVASVDGGQAALLTVDQSGHLYCSTVPYVPTQTLAYQVTCVETNPPTPPDLVPVNCTQTQIAVYRTSRHQLVITNASAVPVWIGGQSWNAPDLQGGSIPGGTDMQPSPLTGFCLVGAGSTITLYGAAPIYATVMFGTTGVVSVADEYN